HARRLRVPQRGGLAEVVVAQRDDGVRVVEVARHGHRQSQLADRLLEPLAADPEGEEAHGPMRARGLSFVTRATGSSLSAGLARAAQRRLDVAALVRALG